MGDTKTIDISNVKADEITWSEALKLADDLGVSLDELRDMLYVPRHRPIRAAGTDDER